MILITFLTILCGLHYNRIRFGRQVNSLDLRSALSPEAASPRSFFPNYEKSTLRPRDSSRSSDVPRKRQRSAGVHP